MSACLACGSELPPQNYRGRPRKWCSERCRKTQYMGECVDCGAPTEGSEGRGPRAPKRCNACAQADFHARRRKSADEREAEIAALYRQGLTAWQIADRLGVSPYVVTNYAARARKHGLEVPFAPTGGRAHRNVAA